MVQSEFVFFGEKDLFDREAPSEDWKKQRVARDGDVPFAKFIGNEQAVRKLQVSAYKALGTYNHKFRELAFAIFGPASAGKTTLIRLYAETVELPFVEVSPKSVRTLEELFKLIRNVFHKAGLDLVEVGERSHYVLPPCVIFFDEVHALSDSLVQGLLKATEYSDGVLVTERGRSIDCRNVTWSIATTDEGKLFDAFRTRFSPIQLTYLTKAEIAKIIKLNHPDFTDEVCELVAHYNSRIPRKALEFARYMELVREMNGGTWDDAARQVATDEGIDQFGMQAIHLKILRALGQGPIAKQRIGIVAEKKDEEVNNFILPWLLADTEDQPALVHVTSKGYTITEAGYKELDKRHIPYKRD